MSLLIRIPTLLVALGLLASGGQAKVCDFVSFVGIDIHTVPVPCDHAGEEHSHSDTEPCSEGCFVEWSEGVVPISDSVPPLPATGGLDLFLSVYFVSLSDCAFFNPVSDIWHGPPRELPPPLHSDPLFSGRLQI